MSFMLYIAKCDKCGVEINTAFGIVGTTQIATPKTDCECGGKFMRTDKLIDWKKP